MEEQKKFTINQIKKMKMTEDEKQSVWDGVLRRVTDYPEGEYPFEKKPSKWDGIKRRKSDYPSGEIPEDVLELIALEKAEREQKKKKDAAKKM